MNNSGYPQAPITASFREAASLCIRPSNVKQKVEIEKSSKSYAQVAGSVKQPAVKRNPGELKLDNSKHSYIGIRFTRAEREIVVKQAEEYGLTISEYVRASVLGDKYLSAIDPVKRELLQNISRELGRQGTNLNQIAKQLNGGTTSFEEGNSTLAVLARSLLSAQQSVRHALAEGSLY